MSLRLRLVISIGLGLLVSVLFGGIFALWDAARQVETELTSAMAVGEHITQTAVGESNSDTDQYQRLERLIREFDGNRHLRAVLLDRAGRPVIASKLVSTDTGVPEWFARLLARSTKTVQVNLPSAFQDYQAIVLTTDSANELAEKWGDIGLALGVLMTFSIFVLALVYWTLAKGLRPLQALNVAFDRVGRGDYSPRVPETGTTELALLAREFNRMASRLSAMQVQNARLNQQLTNVQEEDRAELARELHDEIGPFLFSVGLDISAIHRTVNKNADMAVQLVPRLEAIRVSISHMQKHLKIILGRLRPTVLLDLGLEQAMDNLIDFWRQRHPGVVFDLKMTPESFGERLDEGIYRIVREGLNNALRHGRPGEICINIQLHADDVVAVDVLDDGGGMTTTNSGAVGFGIVGMQERASMLGGTVSVRNRTDAKGVCVSARLPRPCPNEVPLGEVKSAVTAP